MIDCNSDALAFAHAAFDQALLAWLDLDDLAADFVVLGAIAHEHVGHIVGDFAGDGMAILDADGLAGPLQHLVVVVTEQKKKNVPTNCDILDNLSPHIFLGVTVDILPGQT